MRCDVECGRLVRTGSAVAALIAMLVVRMPEAATPGEMLARSPTDEKALMKIPETEPDPSRASPFRKLPTHHPPRRRGPCIIGRCHNGTIGTCRHNCHQIITLDLGQVTVAGEKIGGSRRPLSLRPAGSVSPARVPFLAYSRHAEPER